MLAGVDHTRRIFNIYGGKAQACGAAVLNGATPGQIFLMLTGASLWICVLPVLLGNVFGAAASAMLFHILDEVSRAVIPDRLILPLHIIRRYFSCRQHFHF